MIYGLGISITSKNYGLLKRIISDNIVLHLIAGINDIDILEELKEYKILVLGYKQFGFGVDYYSDEVRVGIEKWRKCLSKYMGKMHISFDNLGIEQLEVKKLFTIEGWNEFYMGDDFAFTMYIDAVKEEFAPTSRSSKRVKFENSSLLEFFNK